MSSMAEKKLYVWRLADFLARHEMRMSGDELADHLNRNQFVTNYGSEYQGTRGTFTLIRETWKWLHDELRLPDEAKKVAEAYVKQDGSYAYS